MTDQTDGLAGTPAQQAAARAVARGFRDKVKKMVDSAGDRALLFEALRTYQQNMEIEQLVAALSGVLNHPDRLPLFHDIRLMIPPRQHLSYNSMVPPPPSNSMRVVTLTRHGKEGFGFSVRGGKEYTCGMYISSVKLGSAASKAQLKVGEELISVDGYPVTELIHEEVLNLLRGARSLRLRLKAVCLLPYQNDGDDNIYWQLIGADGNPHDPKEPGTDDDDEGKESLGLAVLAPGERRVTITKDGQPLGCGIVGGSQLRKGIFVAAVQEGGLAFNAGLQNNDQITSVNGFSFKDLKHSEAVRVLKSSNVLVVTVKSEKDREQQEKWEQQMGQLQEERLLEFAQERPNTEEKTFYISPQFAGNPLEAQVNAPNPYAEASQDDDLGDIDLYNTENVSSDEDDDNESASAEAPRNKDPKPQQTASATAEAAAEASDTSEDSSATSTVVQSHLQRMYIEQQKERHARIHKSSTQRLQLMQEVRQLRKTDDAAKEGDAEATQSKEDDTSKQGSASTADTASEQAPTSTAAVVKMVKEEAVYEEAKIVTMPKSYVAEKGSAHIRSASLAEVAEVGKATALAEQDVQAGAAIPAGFSDAAGNDTSSEQGPNLPPRNTGSLTKETTAAAAATTTAASLSPRYSTVNKNRKKQESTQQLLDQPQKQVQQNKAGKHQHEEEPPPLRPPQHAADGQVAIQRDGVNTQPAEATATTVPDNGKPQTLAYTQVEVKSSGSSGSKPSLAEKPVPSPKSKKKVVLVDSPAEAKKTPYATVTVVATEETARHSPPPPSAAVAHKSSLKTSQDKDAAVAVRKTKPRMKKQASFATDVECVVIKPPDSRHLSMNLEELEAVNPSNLEFGEDVLQGRKAEFHSIPKDGPLGIKLRGGVGTSTGGKILIAGINDDGAVGRYGKLHAGDQILMVDGTSFIDIGQKEATQALHEAMQWETECIDVVVATQHGT
ncbi:harmonin-like [Sycon ciliatum]|uniref:harmonin-like n=1 Tax=Sycon ciliatum TaxID=27933 RepID=UPI0031F63E94